MSFYTLYDEERKSALSFVSLFCCSVAWRRRRKARILPHQKKKFLQKDYTSRHHVVAPRQSNDGVLDRKQLGCAPPRTCTLMSTRASKERRGALTAASGHTSIPATLTVPLPSPRRSRGRVRANHPSADPGLSLAVATVFSLKPADPDPTIQPRATQRHQHRQLPSASARVLNRRRAAPMHAT